MKLQHISIRFSESIARHTIMSSISHTGQIFSHYKCWKVCFYLVGVARWEGDNFYWEGGIGTLWGSFDFPLPPPQLNDYQGDLES